MAQIPGSSMSGIVKTIESRRKRKRVYHAAVNPKEKVNTVMKVETIKVPRRIARAGPISRMFSVEDFPHKRAAMADLKIG